jgi:hypothetical protein
LAATAALLGFELFDAGLESAKPRLQPCVSLGDGLGVADHEALLLGQIEQGRLDGTKTLGQRRLDGVEPLVVRVEAFVGRVEARVGVPYLVPDVLQDLDRYVSARGCTDDSIRKQTEPISRGRHRPLQCGVEVT